MSVILNKPFESKYGFKSVGFSVDENGNIVANSIVLNSVDDNISATPADFLVTNSSNDFIFTSLGINPTLTLSKSTSYIFDLTLTGLDFTIYGEDQISLYSTGLRHSDGTTNSNAQSKSSGRLVFTIPTNAPDTLYYGSSDNGPIGTINVVDPDGVFNIVTVHSTIESTSTSTGSLVVAGGVGIGGDLYIGGDLNVGGTGIPNIISPTNLVLGANNKIDIQINSTLIGYVNNSGSTVPLIDTTITNSTINNTVIGNTTPTTASFTSATVSAVTGVNGVTNKNYVDTTATALAITFGL